MGIFDKFIDKQKRNKEDEIISQNTTEGFYIGVAEAEGEANNSVIPLNDVFEDYLDVISQINNEKFIITGRKGSGKTAIGEYIVTSIDANTFSTFIKKSDIDIEEIVQIENDRGFSVQRELLFKWIILTQILNLFTKNEKLCGLKDMSNLKKFIDKNRGFVNIDKFEIKEISRSSGLNINLEYFKRFYTCLFSKNIAIKESKTDFYKLIPYLEEAVIQVLREDPDNSYILIFDDLDINYTNDETQKSILVNLLRIVKYYNNDIFGRNKFNSKIIILLRNDIADRLICYADTAKIFASYAIELNWYEDSLFRTQENKLKLKQFINKRIACNFERKGITYNKENPWESFISEDGYTFKSSFKYIIDHTFYRPRDLILFFKDINEGKFPIPLSKENIKILIGNYANQMILEIQNELAAIFTKDEIQKIFNILKLYSKMSSFTYANISFDLKNIGFDKNIDDIIENLFYYSLIGNRTDESNICFKFREKGGDMCKMNRDNNFILHHILDIYFKKNAN